MKNVIYDLDAIDPDEKDDGGPTNLVGVFKSIKIPTVAESLAETLRDIKLDDPFRREQPGIDQATLDYWEEKGNQEDEIRRLNLEMLRKQHRLLFPISPKYNPKTAVLTFSGQNIQIPLNSIEANLCEIIFKNKQSMQKQWSWDLIAEFSGNEADNKQRYVVYRAAKRVRDKVAKKTKIEDFLLVTTQTIQVHPDYI